MTPSNKRLILYPLLGLGLVPLTFMILGGVSSAYWPSFASNGLGWFIQLYYQQIASLFLGATGSVSAMSLGFTLVLGLSAIASIALVSLALFALYSRMNRGLKGVGGSQGEQEPERIERERLEKEKEEKEQKELEKKQKKEEEERKQKEEQEQKEREEKERQEKERKEQEKGEHEQEQKEQEKRKREQQEKEEKEREEMQKREEERKRKEEQEQKEREEKERQEKERKEQEKGEREQEQKEQEKRKREQQEKEEKEREEMQKREEERKRKEEQEQKEHEEKERQEKERKEQEKGEREQKQKEKKQEEKKEDNKEDNKGREDLSSVSGKSSYLNDNDERPIVLHPTYHFKEEGTVLTLYGKNIEREFPWIGVEKLIEEVKPGITEVIVENVRLTEMFLYRPLIRDEEEKSTQATHLKKITLRYQEKKVCTEKTGSWGLEKNIVSHKENVNKEALEILLKWFPATLESIVMININSLNYIEKYRDFFNGFTKFIQPIHLTFHQKHLEWAPDELPGVYFTNLATIDIQLEPSDEYDSLTTNLMKWLVHCEKLETIRMVPCPKGTRIGFFRQGLRSLSIKLSEWCENYTLLLGMPQTIEKLDIELSHSNYEDVRFLNSHLGYFTQLKQLKLVYHPEPADYLSFVEIKYEPVELEGKVLFGSLSETCTDLEISGIALDTEAVDSLIDLMKRGHLENLVIKVDQIKESDRQRIMELDDPYQPADIKLTVGRVLYEKQYDRKKPLPVSAPVNVDEIQDLYPHLEITHKGKTMILREKQGYRGQYYPIQLLAIVAKDMEQIELSDVNFKWDQTGAYLSFDQFQFNALEDISLSYTKRERVAQVTAAAYLWLLKSLPSILESLAVENLIGMLIKETQGDLAKVLKSFNGLKRLKLYSFESTRLSQELVDAIPKDLVSFASNISTKNSMQEKCSDKLITKLFSSDKIESIELGEYELSADTVFELKKNSRPLATLKRLVLTDSRYWASADKSLGYIESHLLSLVQYQLNELVIQLKGAIMRPSEFDVLVENIANFSKLTHLTLDMTGYGGGGGLLKKVFDALSPSCTHLTLKNLELSVKDVIALGQLIQKNQLKYLYLDVAIYENDLTREMKKMGLTVEVKLDSKGHVNPLAYLHYCISQSTSLERYVTANNETNIHDQEHFEMLSRHTIKNWILPHFEVEFKYSFSRVFINRMKEDKKNYDEFFNVVKPNKETIADRTQWINIAIKLFQSTLKSVGVLPLEVFDRILDGMLSDKLKNERVSKNIIKLCERVYLSMCNLMEKKAQFVKTINESLEKMEHHRGAIEKQVGVTSSTQLLLESLPSDRAEKSGTAKKDISSENTTNYNNVFVSPKTDVDPSPSEEIQALDKQNGVDLKND